MAFKILSCVVISLLLTIGKVVTSTEFCVLSINNPTGINIEFCMAYYKQIFTLPEAKSTTCFHHLRNETATDLCAEELEQDFTNETVLVYFNQNCSIEEQAFSIQQKNAVSVLFIVPEGTDDLSLPDRLNTSFPINITVGLVHVNVLEVLKKSVTVCIYDPFIEVGLDVTFPMMWLIAMFTVTIGSNWSGVLRYTIYYTELAIASRRRSRGRRANSTSSSSSTRPRQRSPPPPQPSPPREPSSLNIPISAIFLYVGFIVGMLMLLFFFYDYVVYFMIALFAILSVLSTYSCLKPIVKRILPDCWVIKQWTSSSGTVRIVEYRNVLVLLISLTLSIAWVVLRNESYAWAFLDILGIMFCIHCIRSFRLSSLKVCTVFMVLLFFYDIFFVFITPLFTVGRSIMEQVADNGKFEKLPMLFQIPHFDISYASACGSRYSILGFGDVIVPALLVSLCRGYDLIRGTKWRYFAVCLSGYGIGLLITFVCLLSFRTAQPALVQLVPCTLIPTVIYAHIRGDLKQLWKGVEDITAAQIENIVVPENAIVTARDYPARVEIPPVVDENVVPTTSETVPERTNESKHLLR